WCTNPAGIEPVKPRNEPPARNGLRDFLGVPSRWSNGERQCRHRNFWISMSDSPGSERTACQEGMRSESSEPLAGHLPFTDLRGRRFILSALNRWRDFPCSRASDSTETLR